MIVKQDLVKKIKEYFNLNIYETKVWLALLSKGIVSAGETAELSGVPRSRTYDVLESLEKRGFAIVKLGKPVKYIAVEPSTIVEKMKSNVMTEAQERVVTLSNLKETQEYTELEQLHKTGLAPIKSEDISGFLKGKPNVTSKIREMITGAEKEVTIYTTASDFEKRARVLMPLIEQAQKRSIKVKIALAGEADEVKKLSNKHALKAKHADHKGRMYIADKKEIVFMLNHDNAEEELAVWLKSPFFSESIDIMADYHIKRAI
jgi:sugar-specific transcriptional regulator TrmB